MGRWGEKAGRDVLGHGTLLGQPLREASPGDKFLFSWTCDSSSDLQLRRIPYVFPKPPEREPCKQRVICLQTSGSLCLPCLTQYRGISAQFRAQCKKRTGPASFPIITEADSLAYELFFSMFEPLLFSAIE